MCDSRSTYEVEALDMEEKSAYLPGFTILNCLARYSVQSLAHCDKELKRHGHTFYATG